MSRLNTDLVGPVDLSAADAFQLGPLEITPSTREVRYGTNVALAEPRALQVLTALYQADGSVVSRDELVRRCWEGRIVGEDAINRSIAKARQLADLVSPPAFVIETIPRVGYRLKPADTVESKLDVAAVGHRPPRADIIPRRLLLISGGVTAISAGAGGAAWLMTRPKPTGSQPTIAVLPFDNLSQDPQLGYFADGLSEDILNTLVRAGGLRVTAPSSSFTFRGPAKAKAGQALNVAYLLDGSVLRDGERLRVNAHLSDVATSQTVWSDTFDRQVAQGLQLEDDITAQVADALKVRLAHRTTRRGLIDPAVYELYLKGRDGNRINSVPGLNAARAALEEAARRDPEFAPVQFELAKNAWRRTFLEGHDQTAGTVAVGQTAARRALALDPNNGAAYAVLSQLGSHYGRFEQTEELGLKAMALSPDDANVLLLRAPVLLNTGRLAEAARTAERAVALDPLEVFATSELALVLTYASRFAEAHKAVDRLRSVWPGGRAAYFDRFWLMVAEEKFVEAADYIQRPEGRPVDKAGEFSILAQALKAIVSGDAAQKATAVQANLVLAAKGTGYAAYAIVLLARLGDANAALSVAHSLYLKQGGFIIDRNHQFLGGSGSEPYDEPPPMYLFHPFMAELRRSGRLNSIFDAIGLTAFWKTHPPDFQT